MAVLDTSFLIDLEKGASGALALHGRLTSALVALRVPAAVWVEYLSGFDPNRRLEVSRLLKGSVTFEPFHQELADRAAAIQFTLLTKGIRMGWHDLQVAATAVHLGEPLVTVDDRFGTVEGLEIFGW